MSEILTIRSDRLAASFSPRGAELQDLRVDGRPVLWQRDDRWWSQSAPILFPVIGRSPGAGIFVSGKRYPMPPHGFARDMDFQILAATPDRIEFELSSNEETRRMFPFDFSLQIEAMSISDTLHISAFVSNTGTVDMYCSLGFHPGFLWPQDLERRHRHVCIFESKEPGAIRRANLETGLLREDYFPSPLAGRVLNLSDAIFGEGTIMFESLVSRRVWFGEAGKSGIEIAFPNCRQLAIWTKPGAPFLCIEPWRGLPEAESKVGELSERPFVDLVLPGERVLNKIEIRPGMPNSE